MFDQAGTELSQVTATLNQLKAKRDDLLENLKTASAQLTGPTGPAGKSWMVGL
jgi:ABC-type transporter Mla subunit MlaD